MRGLLPRQRRARPRRTMPDGSDSAGRGEDRRPLWLRRFSWSRLSCWSSRSSLGRTESTPELNNGWFGETGHGGRCRTSEGLQQLPALLAPHISGEPGLRLRGLLRGDAGVQVRPRHPALRSGVRGAGVLEAASGAVSSLHRASSPSGRDPRTAASSPVPIQAPLEDESIRI